MTPRIKIIELTDLVFVVAHNEDTLRLESALENQGFRVHVQRGPYTPIQERFSRQLKCLINHANVWRQVAVGGRPTLVFEADFVPVSNFAQRWSPLPNRLNDDCVGFAWLYSAGSILYGFDCDDFPHGHGNTMVAYVLTPRVAKILLAFFDREMERTPGGTYANWDSYLGIYLREEHNIFNYIPVYQFGEHGGTPQPEHARQGVRAWHQADVLLDSLEYVPPYARGRLWLYALYRFRSYARGWARLVLGRFYHPRRINDDTTRSRFSMLLFSIGRMLKLVKP